MSGFGDSAVMSDLPKSDSRRLDALEERIAHQDHTLGELNEVIAAQWRQIDRLTRELGRLREELQTIGPQRNAPEPPPPHY